MSRNIEHENKLIINEAKRKLETLRTAMFKSNINELHLHLENYFKTFDQHSIGYDNYADEILSNIRGLNNESHTWGPGLDLNETISSVIQYLRNSDESGFKTSFKISEETKKMAASFNHQAFKINLGGKSKIEDITNNIKETTNKKFTFKSIPDHISPPSTGVLSFGSTEKLISPQNQIINRSSLKFSSSENSFGLPLFVKNSNFNRNQPEIDQQVSNRANNDFQFRTAKEQLAIDNQKKNSNSSNVAVNSPQISSMYGANSKKTLGPRKRVWGEFVLPIPGNKNEQCNKNNSPSCNSNVTSSTLPANSKYDGIISHEQLKQFEPRLIESVLNEIMKSGKPVCWDDIIGLESIKILLEEIIIQPKERPDLFCGVRKPPKGLLLFGPPGTGKTLIAKCVASQIDSTFFSISASSLTSKWVGEGEKMVRVMFTVARLLQPSVIFIDEIDSLLTQRNETEHESSRRIKTEFLIQMDGVTTDDDDQLLLIGATNRPYELDEAALRRFERRLYIPLPSQEARKQLIGKLMKDLSFSITPSELDTIIEKSNGFSAADIQMLCREASMGPIRRLSKEQFKVMSAAEMAPVTYKDFEVAFRKTNCSVSPINLEKCIEWNNLFGG